MTGGLINVIRGIGGEPESIRTLGLIGGLVYIIGAHGFVAWEIGKDRAFDLTAYCLAFPTGLGAILAAIAGAVAWKDQGIASAKVTEQTGAIPAKPPAGPRVPTGEPPPVDEPA